MSTSEAARRAAEEVFGDDGILARAEAKLLRSLADRPDDVRRLWQLATVQRRQGDIAAALATCERILLLQPEHPRASWTSAVLTGAGVRDLPPPKGFVPAPFTRTLRFLDQELCDALLALAVATRERFVAAKVAGSDTPNGELKRETRHALVATRKDFVEMLPWFLPKLTAAAEGALARLPVRDLESYKVELEMTAHGNDGFFQVHRDGSMAACSGRRLSYVYYFHRQPRPFRGGDLLLYDTDRQAGNFEMGVFTRIEPLRNSIVFFPSDCFHEITPVSGAEEFGDARFTVNGWFTVQDHDAALEAG